MTDTKIAAVYVRVSTDEQTELSPDSQLEKIMEYAVKNSLIVPDDYIFMDEGISGRSAKKRPQFNQMIGLAKQSDHPISAVLVWKFSRFARNQEESIVYKAMLRKSGVEVISVSEPIIDGPFGSLIERIIEWMDEYYSIRLSGEVKRSMTVNAQRGVRQTAPPFGYQLGPKDGPFMIPHPEEAEIIRECYRLYISGVPVIQLVKDLNSRGVLTHRGTEIENRTIMYWLQNPVYIGKNRWTPTGRTLRDFHNPDTVIVDGDHEPLVDEDLYAAVQELVRVNSEKYRPKSRPSTELKDWMGGVVRCADCGSTLVFQAPRYLICNGYVHGRCNHRQSIRLDALHDAVLEKLRSDLSSSRSLSCQIHAAESSDSSRKSLEAQLSQLERRLSRARDSYTAGIDTLEEYRKYHDSLTAEIFKVKAELEQLDSKKSAEEISSTLRKNIRTTLDTLESPVASKELKNSAIRDIIENCVWDKSISTLSITYRIYL